MVIIKFALIIFLIALTWFVAYLSQLYQPRPGMNYYLDMSALTPNSIQARYRISYPQALEHAHALEVACFPGGVPYRITKFSYGQRLSSSYYYVDGYHRLRYTGTQNFWGAPIYMRRASPIPPDESSSLF
jgi:hypothetical protein